MAGPWSAGAGFGPDGLTIRGRSARELAGRFGTPLVVVDEGHVRERCRAFADAYERVLWAVKAFPAQALIRIAHDEGLGLLAATGGELDTCLRAGVPAEDVVLHGNNKLDEEIDLATRAGVGLLILDNEEEIDRVDRAAAARGRPQPVLLRIAPGIEVSSHAYVATGVPDTKFGIPAGLAASALKRALAADHLEVRGVHAHVGSQLLDSAPYLGALEVALAFLQEARDDGGFEAELLDLGGGMGARYTDEEPPEPGDIAGPVREALERGCAERGLPVPTLIAEPGRAITSSAACTIYRVGTIKEVPGIRTYVAVDGGMSDNIRPALYDARYTVAVASRASEAPPAEVTIVGRHCESGDVLARDATLPDDLARDDLVAFAGTGAYEYAMASTYNKVGRPAVVLVGGDGPRLILRREEPADLARLDAGPPHVDAPPSPAGIEVRPANARDARGVMGLVAEVAAERRFIRTERIASPPGEFRARLRRSWTADGAEIVALDGTIVVGHLGVAREAAPALRHVASIGMSVRRAYRGRGVGSALMAEAIRWAREVGVEKLSLSVFPHNAAAIALYRKFGFVEEGVFRGHTKKSYGYEDEVVMARWL